MNIWERGHGISDWSTLARLHVFDDAGPRPGIVLADIKPENIMCQTRTGTNVKLIDFGLATKLDPNEVVKISTGTAEFAAPEIVEREPVGFYTDMWAVGVLAYVL